MTDLNTLNPAKLNFIIKQKVLRIVNTFNKTIYHSQVDNLKEEYKLTWKINRNEVGNIISSPIVGLIFVATYYQNDDTVELILCDRTQGVDGYRVQWTLNIKECGLYYRKLRKFRLTKYPQIHQHLI